MTLTAPAPSAFTPAEERQIILEASGKMPATSEYASFYAHNPQELGEHNPWL